MVSQVKSKLSKSSQIFLAWILGNPENDPDMFDFNEVMMRHVDVSMLGLSQVQAFHILGDQMVDIRRHLEVAIADTTYDC